MALAISENYLREIYNMTNEDKLDLVDLIINSMRVAKSRINISVNKRSKAWIDELEGKWGDDKSVEEMISDIKSSRTKNTSIVL